MYNYNLEYKHAHIVASYDGQPVLDRHTDTEIGFLCSTKENPSVYINGSSFEKAKFILNSVVFTDQCSFIESVIAVEYPLISLLSLDYTIDIKAKKVDKLGKTEIVFRVDIEELKLSFIVEFGKLYFQYPANSEYIITNM